MSPKREIARHCIHITYFHPRNSLTKKIKPKPDQAPITNYYFIRKTRARNILNDIVMTQSEKCGELYRIKKKTSCVVFFPINKLQEKRVGEEKLD